MKEHITEIKIGKTMFVVCAEHSPEAKETVEQKLKRLVIQHALGGRKVNNKLSNNRPNSLDIKENLR
jgi:hypothetical protein